MPPFVRDLLKNFPDYKNFPCSNATTLHGVLGLWGVAPGSDGYLSRPKATRNAQGLTEASEGWTMDTKSTYIYLVFPPDVAEDIN